MREILQGVVDVHIHTGPSIAKREVDAGDMMKLALEAGYRAFVVKDHYFPTMMSANQVEKFLGEGKIKVFGGIALNNSVGGINVKAVDIAYGMGAKFVWMPTVSSHHHMAEHKGHFPGSGASSVPEKPIIYADETGNLLPEVHEVIQYVAGKPDLILATGHGSAHEVDCLVHAAAEAGVKNIFVNHPFFLVGASFEQIEKWGKLGAYIELNAGVFKPAMAGVVSYDVVAKILEIVPIDQLVIDSDYGQVGNGSPVEGLYQYIIRIMEHCKVTEAQINKMAKETPAKLMGL